MHETIRILDEVSYIVRDKNGKIKASKTVNQGFLYKLMCKLGLRHNSMTNIGFAQMAAWCLKDIDADHITYLNCDWIGIGTGVTAADPTDHDMEVAQGVRQAGTGTRITNVITNNTAQLVADFSQAIDTTLTGTDAITEVGMFWKATDDNTMIMRQVFAAESLDWDAGDTLQMTIKIQMKQGA